MSVAVYVPDVGDAFFLQVGVHALTDADQVFSLAAGKPEQFQILLGAIRIGDQLQRRFRALGAIATLAPPSVSPGVDRDPISD